MRKSMLLASVVAAVTMSASAQELVHSDFYREDFRKMSLHSDVLTDGWLTYGVDAAPYQSENDVYNLAGYFQSQGPGTKLEDYVLLSFDDESYAMCSTTFAQTDGEPTAADQWMISPEFEMTDDDAVLMFRTARFSYAQWGNSVTTFDVMISDGGTDKESFVPVTSGSFTLSTNQLSKLNTKNFGARINGYKGKKVRLAFVVKGTNGGLFGFSNIIVSNYALSVQNNTKRAAVPGDQVKVEVNIGLKAPVSCPSMDVTLEYNDVKIVKNVAYEFGSASNSVIYRIVQFKDDPIVIGTEPIYYRITIQPNFNEDEASYQPEPSYFDAVITVPQKFWPNNVVIEEGTATGCGWCPRGIAALEYYTHNYPGTAEVGKAIPIGIHTYMNYPDPMNVGVESYGQGLYGLNATTGLPQAMFNRATRGKDPTAVKEFTKQIEQQSVYSAQITGVQYPDNPKIGDKVNVLFDVRCGFTAKELPLLVTCVLTEDNVRGNASGYSQTNYFFRYPKSQAESLGVGFIAEELSPFFNGAPLGMEHIPFDAMTYNHVARGIWPDFEGTKFGSDWVCDQPVAGSISFTLPDNITGMLADNPEVVNVDNLSAVIMVMDPLANYTIVASDVVKLSGARVSVKEVADVKASATRKGNLVTVNAPEGSTAEIYSVDGIRQAAFAVDGKASAEIDASGIVIVRVSTPEGTAVIKL